MKVSNEFKVGSFVLAMITIFYLSLNFLKGKNFLFGKHNGYYIIYDKGGAKIGDYVLIKGMKVGHVTKTVFLKKKFKIKVYFVIDKDIILTDKVKAVLYGPGLIPGRSSITLEYSGFDGFPLKPGSEIQGSISQAFTEEIMNTTLPLLDYIKSASLLISEQAAKINSTIGNLEFLTYTFKNFIIKNRTLFDDITLNVSRILTSFSDENKGLGKLISNLGVSLKKMNGLNVKELNNSIVLIKKILLKSQESETTLGKIINEDDLYKNLNSSLKNLNDLLVNVRAQPGRYFHFSVFGKKPVKR